MAAQAVPNKYDTVKRVVYTAVFAFVGVLATAAPGLLAAPNLDNGKAVLTAAVAAAFAAAGSLVKNLVFSAGHPLR